MLALLINSFIPFNPHCPALRTINFHRNFQGSFQNSLSKHQILCLISGLLSGLVSVCSKYFFSQYLMQMLADNQIFLVLGWPYTSYPEGLPWCNFWKNPNNPNDKSGVGCAGWKQQGQGWKLGIFIFILFLFHFIWFNFILFPFYFI